MDVQLSLLQREERATFKLLCSHFRCFFKHTVAPSLSSFSPPLSPCTTYPPTHAPNTKQRCVLLLCFAGLIRLGLPLALLPPCSAAPSLAVFLQVAGGGGGATRLSRLPPSPKAGCALAFALSLPLLPRAVRALFFRAIHAVVPHKLSPCTLLRPALKKVVPPLLPPFKKLMKKGVSCLFFWCCLILPNITAVASPRRLALTGRPALSPRERELRAAAAGHAAARRQAAKRERTPSPLHVYSALALFFFCILRT